MLEKSIDREKTWVFCSVSLGLGNERLYGVGECNRECNQQFPKMMSRTRGLLFFFLEKKKRIGYNMASIEFL